MDTSPVTPLKILLVEDSPEDVTLALRALRGLPQPVVTEAVATERALREALVRFAPDVVLSDFSMPGFSGQQALTIVHEFDPELPFIFVSGTIGEELAIEAMQRGAADYVLKDNLRRLQPAVERALRSARERHERQRMQRALLESEERFRAIVESTEDWIWEIDAQMRHTYSNGSVETILGIPAELLLGRSSLEWMHADDRRELLTELPQLTERGWRGKIRRWQHVDGSERILESTGHALRDERGEVVGYRGICRDVTLRLQQEAKIGQLARIQGVLGALGNAVLRARDTEDLLSLACRLAVEQGHFSAACIGVRNPGGMLELSSHYGDPAVVDLIASLGPLPLDSDLKPEDLRPAQRALRDNRKVVVPDVAAADLPEENKRELQRVGVAAQIALPIGEGKPWGVLGLFSGKVQEFDDDEIALLERLTAELDYARDFIAKSERLEFLAHHNPVTGLPNRAAFRDLLAARLDQGPMLVGVLDYVRFHYVIDSRGRAFAEKLLASVGRRLANQLGPQALFAHPAGNTYLFAISSPSLAEGLATVESLLADCARAPFSIEGEQIHIGLRGGVALAPEQGRELDTLERHAVTALTEATKRDLPVVAYSEELHSRAERRIVLDRELRMALAAQQFELYLQPKFDARDRRLTGAEALLRWRHPERGLVSPAEFIPILEETGLINEAGHWVMATALRLLARWRANGQEGVRVAINVSARELRQEGFVERCTELLDAAHDDHGLDIEVTESLLMDDITQNIRVLDALRDLGCQIAIDDFGTGYSSLNYLARLPADVLKVDQSFTAQIASSPEMLALVTNIIGLAHSLNLKVVAEGVEGEEQEKLLRLLRCDELQGYLLGRPMPIADFEQKFLVH